MAIPSSLWWAQHAPAVPGTSGRTAACAAGTGIVLLASIAAGVVLHLNLPPARRLIAREVNLLLAPLFEGRLTVERLGALHTTGIGGADVRIDAADGHPIILAHGVRARVHPVALLRSALFGEGNVVVDVSDIRIDAADVSLDSGETVAPEIADAFALRASTASTPASASAAARGVRLSLDGIQIGHAWAHGTLRGGPPIDADVDDLRASLRVAPEAVTIDATRFTLTARGMIHAANPSGHATAHLAIPLGSSTEPLRIEGSLAGDIGGVPVLASASTVGSQVDAILDVPEVAAETIRALFPEVPLAAAVAGHAEAHGPLSNLAVSARSSLAQGEIDVTAELSVVRPVAGTWRLRARRLDARAFEARAPATSLDLDGRGSLESRPDGWSMKATGTIDEPGATATVTALLHRRGALSVVDFGVKAHAPHLEEVQYARALGAKGSVDLDASGSVLFGSPVSVELTVDARARELRRGSVRVALAHVRARARGAASDPAIEAALDAEDLHVGRRDFSSATVAATDVHLGPSTHVRNARVTVSRDGTSLEATARSVAVSSDALAVEGMVVAGPGVRLGADVRVAPGTLSVRADSSGVDLERLGRFLGVDDDVKGGLLTVSVNLTADHDGAEGSASIDLERGSFARIGPAEGHLEATMKGRRTEGLLHARLGDLATVDVDRSHIEIGGGGPLALDSWRNAWGSVAFRGKVDLARLSALVPAGTLPVSEVSGTLVLEGHATRARGSDSTPGLILSAKTEGLMLARRVVPDVVHDGTTIGASTPWKSSGVDVQLDAWLDGATGAGELATRLVDREGVVVAVDLKSNANVYAHVLGPHAGPLEDLMRMPFAALVFVPERPPAHFPAVLQLPLTDGTVTASVLVGGTVETPSLDATVKISGATLPGVTERFDTDLEGHYDGAAGDVTMDVRSGQKAHLLRASAHLDASVRDLLAGNVDGPWTASAKASLDAFPLAAIEVFSDRQVKGVASGQLDIRDLHKNASMRANVQLSDFVVGTAAYPSVEANIVLDGRALDAQLSVKQAQGFARASAKVGTRWGASLLPSHDETGSVEAAFQARQLRLAVLTPFLRNTADELDGVVDADARLSLHANQKPQMQGSISLTDGRVELSALGEEFHGVTAKVVLTPDGIVRLQHAVALGTSGRITVAGTARLDGVELVSAEAVANVAKKEAIPVHLQGSNLGTMYGRIEMKAAVSADQRMTGLNLTIPSLHVQLPDSSSHVVQGLEAPFGAHVGVFVAPHRFTTLPLGPPPDAQVVAPKHSELRVAVHLGNDVEVRRGTNVRVALAGDASVLVAARTTVTGQIRLERGKLNLQGKTFEIEKGTVTFVGQDAANPQVRVTAGWTAPDGTRVYADFVGPLKTGKVKLRSEPARPESEIVSLITFGSADGSATTPYATQSADANTSLGTTVGGFATEGLSRGLDHLTGLDVTAKLDTSTVNPRPEVEVQIARDISLQLAVVLGTPPPGTNLDTTYATIDWRFFRNWSLATTFGDKGSSIADVIWRHRY
jgi:translocation and assembly module TamB